MRNSLLAALMMWAAPGLAAPPGVGPPKSVASAIRSAGMPTRIESRLLGALSRMSTSRYGAAPVEHAMDGGTTAVARGAVPRSRPPHLRLYQQTTQSLQVSRGPGDGRFFTARLITAHAPLLSRALPRPGKTFEYEVRGDGRGGFHESLSLRVADKVVADRGFFVGSDGVRTPLK